MITIENIKILILREFLILKKQSFSFFSLSFILPCFIYVFFAVPFSKVFTELKPIYSIWVCSGILLVSVLFTVYLLNFNWIKKIYNSNFMNSLPITTIEYFISQLLFSIIIGLFQFTVSALVLNSLSIGFISFSQFLKCFFVLLPSIILVSNLSLIVNSFFKKEYIFNFFNCLFFLFISFSIGSFIPIYLYPSEYINFIIYLPISSSLINIQNIISFQTIFFNMLFISIFYCLVFCFISYNIIDRKVHS